MVGGVFWGRGAQGLEVGEVEQEVGLLAELAGSGKEDRCRPAQVGGFPAQARPLVHLFWGWGQPASRALGPSPTLTSVFSSLTTISTGAGTMTTISGAVQCSTWPPCSGWPCSARRSWTGSARSLEVGWGWFWGTEWGKGRQAQDPGEVLLFLHHLCLHCPGRCGCAGARCQPTR